MHILVSLEGICCSDICVSKNYTDADTRLQILIMENPSSCGWRSMTDEPAKTLASGKEVMFKKCRYTHMMTPHTVIKHVKKH